MSIIHKFSICKNNNTDTFYSCDNCGAHISSKTYEYCNTSMKDVYYDFCLAKIGLANNRQVIDIDLKK